MQTDAQKPGAPGWDALVLLDRQAKTDKGTFWLIGAARTGGHIVLAGLEHGCWAPQRARRQSPRTEREAIASWTARPENDLLRVCMVEAGGMCFPVRWSRRERLDGPAEDTCGLLGAFLRAGWRMPEAGGETEAWFWQIPLHGVYDRIPWGADLQGPVRLHMPDAARHIPIGLRFSLAVGACAVETVLADPQTGARWPLFLSRTDLYDPWAEPDAQGLGDLCPRGLRLPVIQYACAAD